MGLTVAILAISGNLDESRLLLIAIANGVDRKFDADLKSFVGILSVPDAFLVLRDFRIQFTSLEVTCLSPDKFPGRNDVSLSKNSLRPGIRQTKRFFERKNQGIKCLCGS